MDNVAWEHLDDLAKAQVLFCRPELKDNLQEEDKDATNIPDMPRQGKN